MEIVKRCVVEKGRIVMEGNSNAVVEKDTDIVKNTREVIRIGPEYYRGHRLVDIRVYFQLEDGLLQPTRKGIAFSMELLPKIIERLQAVLAEGQRSWPEGTQSEKSQV